MRAALMRQVKLILVILQEDHQPGVIVEEGAIVRHAMLGEDSKVEANAVVGGTDKEKISVTSKGAVVAAGSHLAPGEMI